MLDGKQQKQALLREGLAERTARRLPRQGRRRSKACAVAELSSDQKEHLQKVVAMLIEPYRQSDRDEVHAVPQDARRPRCLPPGVLRPERHRQRRRVGHLAAGRPVVRLALPRRAARPRVGQHGGRSEREAERLSDSKVERSPAGAIIDDMHLRGSPVTHISLDRENDLVKQFVRSLPIEADGVALELDGRVVCKVVPAFSETDTQRLIARGRELVRRARERNRGVPARVIECEVQEAVKEVRRRSSQ